MISMKHRLFLDGGILFGTLLCMAYAWTGKCLHEWIGLAVLVLFVVHLWINRRWYANAFRRKGIPMNGIRKLLNGLLLFITVGMIVSSVLLSEYVFCFLEVGGNRAGLTPHLICSYWGFLLMAMHLGLHWSFVMAPFKKVFGTVLSQNPWLGCVVSSFTVVFGVVAFWHQQYGLHLFLRIGTSDLAHSDSLLLFTAEQLLVMGLFIVFIRGVQKWVLERRAKVVS